MNKDVPVGFVIGLVLATLVFGWIWFNVGGLV